MSMVNADAGSVLTQKPTFSPAATLVRVRELGPALCWVAVLAYFALQGRRAA